MNNLAAEQLFVTEAAQALLENRDRWPLLSLARYQVWEIAGIDSLPLVKRLCSDAVATIAPFESLDFIFTGYQYSVLRLGSDRFRLGLYGELGDYDGLTFAQTITQSQVGLRVSAKRCDRISKQEGNIVSDTIAPIPYGLLALLESAALDFLPHIACVEPSHSRLDLQPNRATLARIDGVPLVIWRHQLLSQPVFELHPPVGDTKAIEANLINIKI